MQADLYGEKEQLGKQASQSDSGHQSSFDFVELEMGYLVGDEQDYSQRWLQLILGFHLGRILIKQESEQ